MCPSGEAHSRQKEHIEHLLWDSHLSQEQGSYGEQEGDGSCSSRNVWPECLVLPGLGEGCGAGMRGRLGTALMADL